MSSRVGWTRTQIGVEERPGGRSWPAWRALGIGSAVFRRALAAAGGRGGPVTPEMVQQAEWIAGLELTDDERKETAEGLKRTMRLDRGAPQGPRRVRRPPAIAFIPAPTPSTVEPVRRNQAVPTEGQAGKRPDSDDALAFLPVTELAAPGPDPAGHLDRADQALPRPAQAVRPAPEGGRHADGGPGAQAGGQGRRRAGRRALPRPAARHPLGGQGPDRLSRLPDHLGGGPVQGSGDQREGDRRRPPGGSGGGPGGQAQHGSPGPGGPLAGGDDAEPLGPAAGVEGSSAGSASTVAAGLVGFAIGSETLGSIVSPCRACGASGLRPTFGRVSRAGCMTLSWSMDKLGPITRSMEDTALILDAIHGSDGGRDISAVDRPFALAPPRRDPRPPRRLRPPRRPAGRRPRRPEGLEGAGRHPGPDHPADGIPAGAISMMLSVEAAAAFDDLTRRHVTEGLNTWPATFREKQFVSAVEYLRAARVRTLLMRAMADLMKTVDLYIGGNDLTITNLTGHPTAVFPHGFSDRNGRPAPGSITMTGQLYGESTLIAVASAFQKAVGDHLKRPPIDRWLAEEPDREAREKADREAREKEATRRRPTATRPRSEPVAGHPPRPLPPGSIHGPDLLAVPGVLAGQRRDQDRRQRRRLGGRDREQLEPEAAGAGDREAGRDDGHGDRGEHPAPRRQGLRQQHQVEGPRRAARGTGPADDQHGPERPVADLGRVAGERRELPPERAPARPAPRATSSRSATRTSRSRRGRRGS